ncbi:hypothetical protein CEXT_635191 [Caerostris extrusa]|uniref:Uncharacterized protein n=1 Tax=Caerostris extrusa TaxID=172846 RepID=A0AAV4UNQ5_CAEEX|nr:hypothetical protein CEXT_635191 [Caerostris extrusa]
METDEEIITSVHVEDKVVKEPRHFSCSSNLNRYWRLVTYFQAFPRRSYTCSTNLGPGTLHVNPCGEYLHSLQELCDSYCTMRCIVSSLAHRALHLPTAAVGWSWMATAGRSDSCSCRLSLRASMP